MTESGFPGSLGSLTFEDAASDLKKNPNPKLRHFIKWDQMRACILLFIPFVWASSLRFLCPSNVSLGRTLYLVVIYSPFPPLTLSPSTEENGGPLFSLMPDV